MADSKDKGGRKILVIGGVAAGASAASKAKRVDPDAEVRIIQEENMVSYGACGIPYVVEGIINNIEELIERPPDLFKNQIWHRCCYKYTCVILTYYDYRLCRSNTCSSYERKYDKWSSSSRFNCLEILI
jgi:hypothetical protein